MCFPLQYQVKVFRWGINQPELMLYWSLHWAAGELQQNQKQSVTSYSHCPSDYLILKKFNNQNES